MSYDGFGDRTLAIEPDTGDAVEVLSFDPKLAARPEFSAAVGERVARLARVRHTMYARTRRMERPAAAALRLHSDHVAGWRVSDVLRVTERERWHLDVTVVIALLRQLIPAVALFSRHQRDATIGTIAPERLILTPQGRLVLAEYVLGPGIEQLHYSRERLWRELRVAVPHHVIPSRLPPSADVLGIGIVGVSLLLGRRLTDDEYLVSLGAPFQELTETIGGSTRALSSGFRHWLARALQFDAASFQTTQEAQAGFEELLANERSYITGAAELTQFVSTYQRFVGDPPLPPVPTPSAAAEDASGSAALTVGLSTSSELTRAASPDPTVHSTQLQESLAAPEPSPEDLVASLPSPLVSTPSTEPEPVSADEAPASRFALPSRFASLSDGRWRKYLMPTMAAVVLIQAGAIGWMANGERAPLGDRGELVVQSRPVAARVTIDGEERGLTPYTTELSAGSHVLEVRVGRAEPRVIPLLIRPGVQTGLYIELQSVATVGGLEVRTEPAKAHVSVAGQDRGVTPLVLRDLPPGDVDVIVRLGGREVRQSVRIEPGITSQLVVPLGR